MTGRESGSRRPERQPAKRPRRATPVRLYRALAGLLPPAARRDRDEMARTYGELRAEATTGRARLRLGVRSFAGLAGVLLAEWLEHFGHAGVRRPAGHTTSAWHHPDGATSRQHRPNGRKGRMGFWRQVRYALRTLRKAPSFTLTSVVLVGVGVGAATTIFTLVDHVLLRPLPYPQADRIVTLSNGSFQGPFFRQLETMRTIDDWSATWTGTANLTGAGDPLRLMQTGVSSEFFDLFDAHAMLGRLPDVDDAGEADAVVLDAGAWRRVWGADLSIVGRTIRVDGKPLTVVGVMSPHFSPPEALVGRHVDLWRPLDWSTDALERNDTYVLSVAGRLAPGVGVAAAQDEMDAVMRRLAPTDDHYRDRNGNPDEHAVERLADVTVRGVRTGLGLLMGAVGLLLLVACANVAHLFLARGLGRTREMAVRRALGASTTNLAGQLLVESLLIGLAGGVLGTGLAWLGIGAFVAFNPTALPRQGTVELDPRVLLFAIGVSALTSLVFGMVPALRSVRAEPVEELRGGGRTATSGRGVVNLRNLLVAGEVALSLVLVAAAGLLLCSFLAVQAQDPGFDVAGVWTVPLRLTDPGTPGKYIQDMDGILREVRRVPGVASAAFGITAPLEYVGGHRCCWATHVKEPGREDDPDLLSFIHPVSLEYFRTLGLQVVAGRKWNRSEEHADPVPVVVNETLARSLAGDAAAAVGRTATLGDLHILVVGVARNSHHYGLDEEIRSQLYLPVARLPFAMDRGDIIVRAAAGAGRSVPAALRRAVWAAQPDVPVPTVRSMQSWLDRSTAGRRFDSVIFGVFAAVALLLAAGGLYGTLLYMAGQRRRELGIRLALGASRARIEGAVLRGGVALGVAGIALGLLGAWFSNRLLQSRVWGVGRADPVALGGAAAVLLLTAVVASWLPARRAGRVDPLETLRAE
ncbi:MAG: ABC transporter permease [Gemmatimonadota bacterium]